jgi:ribose transport system ATP-binding protein
VLELGVGENLTLACRERLARRGLLDRAREHEVARAQCDRLRVRAPSLDTRVLGLSGGNQQKVVLGKWLALGGRVLILDEPTRGVDVGARQEIHALVERLAADGLGVLVVSSELEELVALCDRVRVFREGQSVGELAGAEIAERAILDLAVGGAAA